MAPTQVGGTTMSVVSQPLRAWPGREETLQQPQGGRQGAGVLVFYVSHRPNATR
jgi:hypothetical protein